MQVAVIGANGQLGTELVEIMSRQGHDVLALSHADIEITDLESVQQILTSAKPDVVLNTAAYHVTPQCEQHTDIAFAVNARGALHLAKVCADLRSTLVYYSTDYVFDGAKQSPYVETDAPNPLNVYAVSKLAGEYFTLNYCPASYVIRVSGLYGKVPCRAKGGNFITTMIRLAQKKPEVRVVTDEILTPTPTAEIARKTLSILNSEQYGVYHLTCEGACSWYEFAREIFTRLNLQTPLYPATTADFPSPVNRPLYSVLDNQRFNRLDVEPMPHWREALQTFLRKNYSQR
ncbi:dTDP-4-dehydrorhamnose reductase [candidate division KSB3 bacterium]|uniref:dTDP-4-dehydrorhamnose reductase n=1 Tax=candidate division KSB3 bacterium TaxID=2044937 RepID=A0A9D5JXK7_9BACT|nr:dTDP-4-dehydrorhamnose reductase [candidate division KSB3 bacterium]MBD3326169.1 dTDP-4-dehydrorhamnose reductase [candidate division KSB3 bacterium]